MRVCRARHRESGNRAFPDDRRPGGARACARARASSAHHRKRARERTCHQHAWAAAPAGSHQQRPCLAACSSTRPLRPGVAGSKNCGTCDRRSFGRQAAQEASCACRTCSDDATGTCEAAGKACADGMVCPWCSTDGWGCGGLLPPAQAATCGAGCAQGGRHRGPPRGGQGALPTAGQLVIVIYFT